VKRPLGLYIHIPFCRTRCRYCDFYRVGENPERMDSFLSALDREVEGSERWHGRSVDSVFLGGGTPSLLGGRQLRELLGRLSDRFALTADCEITAECNPSDLSRQRLSDYRDAGINRLSIGVQSFNDRELGLIGRRHDAARARRVIEDSQTVGFDHLSFDLILGLPGQTRASFRQSLESAIRLAPDHLSVYILEIHPQAEIDLLRRRRPGLFPDEDAQSDRYRWMVERLEAAGLMRYEISNFARPGRESRHNLKYWKCEPVLGFGPSAHSMVDGRRWRHPPDLRRYLANPTAIEEQPANLAEESLFLGLRLTSGVARDVIEERLGLAPDELDRRIRSLEPYVEMAGETVKLTLDGVLLSTPVLAELLLAESGSPLTGPANPGPAGRSALRA